jgi:AcrR family transcriptional regulator
MDREQRRAQILGIAAEVFAEKGYHDAKIEDIVARARVARGTFYLYFEDKRAIFEELVSGFVRQLAETIEPIETVPDSDPTRVMFELRSNLLRLVERFSAEPAMAKVLFSAAVGLDADFDQRLLAFYEEIANLLERSLEQGEQAGLVRPGHRRILPHRDHQGARLPAHPAARGVGAGRARRRHARPRDRRAVHGSSAGGGAGFERPTRHAMTVAMSATTPTASPMRPS